MTQITIVSVVLCCAVQGAVCLSPPPLDWLASIWQPVDQTVYGAPSVTNCWGSVLASTANVFGFNALEMAPFSSGWDPALFHGWGTDTASLFMNGAPVAPTATLWTPYSVIRRAADVSTELRMVFEDQALLLEANVTVAPLSEVSLDVDMRLPLRYFARADGCSSWHYPTRSEECCWNWFPPEAPAGSDVEATFPVSWEACAESARGGSPFGAMVGTDAHSPAVSAFSFPGACGGGGGVASSVSHRRLNASAPLPHSVDGCRGDMECFRAAVAPDVVDLAGPDAVNGSVGTWHVSNRGAAAQTVRLRLAIVFSNATDAGATAAAAQALAGAFDVAWVDAQRDWQARFDSAFDDGLSHFSGYLPLLATNSSLGGKAGVFDSAVERVYYSSVIGLLANERTNLPPSLPGGGVACLGVLGVSRGVEHADSYGILTDADAAAAEHEQPRRAGLARYLRPVALPDGRRALPRVTGSAFSGGGDRADYAGGRGASRVVRSGHVVDPTALLDEASAPWRMFISGACAPVYTAEPHFYYDVLFECARACVGVCVCVRVCVCVCVLIQHTYPHLKQAVE
jgi:hypothetical protein